MIYYCIYKNECSFKECIYRQTKSKFSAFRAKKDLTISEFTCNLSGRKRVRLISDERLICDRYKNCGINCIFKTSYITVNNYEEYFGKLDLSKPFQCYDIGYEVNLVTAGKSTGNYIDIWNQPNSFVKKLNWRHQDLFAKKLERNDQKHAASYAAEINISNE